MTVTQLLCSCTQHNASRLLATGPLGTHRPGRICSPGTTVR